MFKQRQMTRPLALGMLLMLLATLFTAAPARAALAGPVFTYPRHGDRFGHAGAHLFQVSPIAGATAYEWSFFQNGGLVWQNWRDEGGYSGHEYRIQRGTKAHARLTLGPVEVAVRAQVGGVWTDYARQTVFLTGPLGVPVLQLNYYPRDPNRPEYLSRAETGLTQDILVTTMQAATQGMVDASLPLIGDATRYRGTAATRFLEYSVLEKKDLFTAMPRGYVLGGSKFRPNYGQIMREQNICDYVDNRGVKEVWIYGYHNDAPGGIEPDESRMSSRYGDISNSWPKEQDLASTYQMPKCANSYVLYNFTYQASGDISNTIHNRLHQIENAMFYAENRGYPVSNANVAGSLFWDDFSVYDERGSLPGYRPSCGNAHRPPNTNSEYIYNSTDVVANNCATWHPNDAQTNYVSGNCNQWGCTATGFYSWFMQNMPGYNNGIVFNGKYMRNWWEAMYDFNGFIDSGRSLYTSHALSMATPAVTVSEQDGAATLTVSLNTPATRNVTVGYSTSDGSATAGSDYAASHGSLTFAPGQTSRTISIPLIRDANVEGPESFSVKLHTPINAELSAATVATVTTGTEYEFSMAAGALAVQENAGSVRFAVNLNAPVPAGQSLWVDFAITAGTATVNGDYASTSGTLIFTGGQTSQSTTIAILEDGIRENDETFTINLVSATNARIGAAASTVVSIAANDSLSLPASYGSAEEGVGTLIEVRLNAPSAQPVTVNYATKDGTALAGSDYVAASGTLTFAPGETSRLIGINIIGDGVAEGDETFMLSLSGPVNAQLGKPSSMKITIVELSTEF